MRAASGAAAAEDVVVGSPHTRMAEGEEGAHRSQSEIHSPQRRRGREAESGEKQRVRAGSRQPRTARGGGNEPVRMEEGEEGAHRLVSHSISNSPTAEMEGQ